MKIKLFLIDLRHKNRYKKLWGKFTFWKCPCGCTNHSGYGYMFLFFGVSIQQLDR